MRCELAERPVSDGSRPSKKNMTGLEEKSGWSRYEQLCDPREISDRGPTNGWRIDIYKDQRPRNLRNLRVSSQGAGAQPQVSVGSSHTIGAGPSIGGAGARVFDSVGNEVRYRQTSKTVVPMKGTPETLSVTTSSERPDAGARAQIVSFECSGSPVTTVNSTSKGRSSAVAFPTATPNVSRPWQARIIDGLGGPSHRKV